MLLYTTSTQAKGQTQRHTLVHSNTFPQTPTATQPYSVLHTQDICTDTEAHKTYSDIFTHSYTQACTLEYIFKVEGMYLVCSHSCMLWNTHSSLVRYIHTVSLNHPLGIQLSGQLSQFFLPTHFPPSSGASGTSLQNWGGDGAGFALLMWQLTHLHHGHTLPWERLKGAGITSADLTTRSLLLFVM